MLTAGDRFTENQNPLIGIGDGGVLDGMKAFFAAISFFWRAGFWGR